MYGGAALDTLTCIGVYNIDISATLYSYFSERNIKLPLSIDTATTSFHCTLKF